MKLAALILLLALCLCSCASPYPEQNSASEQPKVKPTDTVTVPEASDEPEEPNEEDSSDAEPESLIEEEIITPREYPGVPDIYVPVLDAFYIDDVRESQENLFVFELSKYAVVDLDDDGTSELVIQTTDSYFKETPYIDSVYAIRDGKVVRIDEEAIGLGFATNTILSSDDTFYQYNDEDGPEYIDLYAFRLEAGMSEFTVTAEAHASLSFSSGDIAVPYYTKTENGETVDITENDFYALLEQYKNPKESMMLDFIPLYPMQIEYPAAYEGAPKEYKPILDVLFLLQERMRQEGYPFYTDDSIADDILGLREYDLLGDPEHPEHEDLDTLGYALADLNDDGVLELLLGCKEGLNNAAPDSIFMIKDGQPVHLQSLWSRYRGAISADGTIYTISNDGLYHTYLDTWRLDKNADIFSQLNFYSNYSESDEKPYYVQIVDGKNRYISQEEFWENVDIYYDPPKRMKLEFIAIAP